MFGKTQRGASERPNQPKKPLIPTWLGTLFAILVLMFIVVLLMLWEPWKPVATQKNSIPSTHYQDQQSDHDYRFYDLLPQQQVTPIPEQAIPETRTEQPVVIVEAPRAQAQENDMASSEVTPHVAEPHQPVYMLQIRSFPDPDSADTLRAEIILNGLSADVVRSVENGTTWYRVISGSYESQNAALAAQQTLQHSGIDSIVIRY